MIPDCLDRKKGKTRERRKKKKERKEKRKKKIHLENVFAGASAAITSLVDPTTRKHRNILQLYGKLSAHLKESCPSGGGCHFGSFAPQEELSPLVSCPTERKDSRENQGEKGKKKKKKKKGKVL